MSYAEGFKYGQMVVKAIGDPQTILQPWMPLDGRISQGQTMDYYENTNIGRAMVQNITYNFTQKRMELTLLMNEDRSKKLLKVRA